MKISASIYSNKNLALSELIKRLDEHKVDYFHIDCNDNLAVFNDIAAIREISKTPIDLHIISETPERYFEGIEKYKIESVFFQYENLKTEIQPPIFEHTSYGLAVVTDTDLDVFEPYKNWCDAILLMTTTPGQSGGTFRKENFQRIRRFRKLFPGKKVHIDGGVNHEVSFVLRNMGVSSVVSGSFLVNNESIGAAMLDLRIHETESHFLVKDFMIKKHELPVLMFERTNFREVLQTIEDYKFGFVFYEDAQERFAGISSNADVRKGMLRHETDFNKVSLTDIRNPKPVTISEDCTIEQMLKMIKSKSFIINFLPVTNTQGKISGAITFFNLIKGES